uniref:Uncharacterized protein n=1 Tax=Panagrolaimus sp. JU765 TaxID=591449 RepID=A0AC34Q011_9BILA
MFIYSHYISSAVLRYDVLKLPKGNQMIDEYLIAVETKAGSLLSIFYINTATLKIVSGRKPIIYSPQRNILKSFMNSTSWRCKLVNPSQLQVQDEFILVPVIGWSFC